MELAAKTRFATSFIFGRSRKPSLLLRVSCVVWGSSPPAKAPRSGWKQKFVNNTFDSILYSILVPRRCSVLPCFAPQGEVLLFRQKVPKPLTPHPSHLIDRTLNTGEQTNSPGSHKVRQEKERPIWGRAAGVGAEKQENRRLEPGPRKKDIKTN